MSDRKAYGLAIGSYVLLSGICFTVGPVFSDHVHKLDDLKNEAQTKDSTIFQLSKRVSEDDAKIKELQSQVNAQKTQFEEQQKSMQDLQKKTANF